MVAQIAGGSDDEILKSTDHAVGTTNAVESERVAAELPKKHGTSDEDNSESTEHANEPSNAQIFTASVGTAQGSGQTKDQKKESGNSNLVGKINNLMSTVGLFSFLFFTEGIFTFWEQDLENVTGGSYFLSVLIYAPVQITLSIFFLYTILGWRWVSGLKS
jgi:hypothetical protein